MKNLLFLLLASTFFLSCNSSVNIFGAKKTPHEAYAAGIEKHPAGKQWIALSGKTLLEPQAVQLPYRQLGYFPGDKPRAIALEFTAKRGEQVMIELQPANASNIVLYADIFKQEGTATTPLLSAEEGETSFAFDAEETATYILRLQPALESSGGYTLSLATGPSLGFPVAGAKARVGSVWGDARDGGERSHEGIDIFAARLTPAIAAADGYISSVKDGGLGGKTVNLKVSGRNLSLYYAHLDQQLVEPGQSVKKGDTLGLVGSTGNAKATSPHLHFGIYTYGGAIDPLPFVNKVTKTLPALTAKDLSRPLQLTKPLALKDREPIKARTMLVPLALTAAGYLVELEDGTVVMVPVKMVKVGSGG